MRYMINRFLRWILDSENHDEPIASRSSTATPVIRIGLIKGINGRMLEVATPRAKNNQRVFSDDWDYEFFVVRDDQLVSEAIAMVMLMKGLNS